MAKTVNDIPKGPLAIVAQNTVPGEVPGNRKWVFKRITADASYVTGGYPILPADVGLGTQIDYTIIINDSGGPPSASNVNSWYWNTVTQKLQAIVISTGAELGNGQSLAGATCDMIFIGT